MLCIVSKEYQRKEAIRYWYAFHPAQQEFLREGKQAYISLGCGTSKEIITIPLEEFERHLPLMRTTESDDRFYWHVEIFRKSNRFLLYKGASDGIDVTQFRI